MTDRENAQHLATDGTPIHIGTRIRYSYRSTRGANRGEGIVTAFDKYGGMTVEGPFDGVDRDGFVLKQDHGYVCTDWDYDRSANVARGGEMRVEVCE